MKTLTTPGAGRALTALGVVMLPALAWIAVPAFGLTVSLSAPVGWDAALPTDCTASASAKWGLDGTRSLRTTAYTGVGSYGSPKAFAADTATVNRRRKAATALSHNEKTLLILAYQRMQALGANDPRGMTQQANLHCYYCGNATGAAGDVHGGWNFLPWHRAMLYYHERVLRGLLKEEVAAGHITGAGPTFNPALNSTDLDKLVDAFALPYWDWPNARDVPSPYDAGAHVANIWRKRAQMQDEMATADQVRALLAQGNAASFIGDATHVGQLETGPHNEVHSWISGDMLGNSTAGRDPLFYAHHANVDRIWVQWRAQAGQGTASEQLKSWYHGLHRNPTDTTWLNTKWVFPDETGQWVQISIRDVLDERTNLKYEYNDDPGRPADDRVRVAQGTPAKPRAALQISKQGKVADAPVTLSAVVDKTQVEALTNEKAAYVLYIRGFQPLQHDKPVLVRVFVNAPDATAKTHVAAPRYVGDLSFRPEPGQHVHAAKPYNVEFELSPDLRLVLAKQPNLKVTLVPVAIDGALPTTGIISFEEVYAQEDTSP